MRLDKYLQVTRLVKRRELTRELCDAGRLRLNDRPAKPAREIKVGDIIALCFWRRSLTVKVSGCPEGNVARKEAGHYYDILDDTPVEEDIPPAAS